MSMEWTKHNYDIYADIRLISSNLNLPKYVENELITKYFHIVRKINYSGDGERLIASLIYHISKRDELFTNIEEISKEIGVEKFSLLRSYKNIMRKVGLNIKPKAYYVKIKGQFFK